MSIAKNRLILILLFTASILGIFTVSAVLFKAAGAVNNSSTRLSVQAITCALSLIAYLLLRAKYGGNPAETSPTPPGWNMPGWGLLGLAFALVPYLLVFSPNEIHWENFRKELVLAAAVMSFSAALFEEIYFRDMLLRWTLPRFGVATATATQIVLFGGAHFFLYRFSTDSIISLAVATLLLTGLWLLTRDFIASTVAHFIIDMTMMIFNGVDTRYIARPGLLLGDTPLSQIYAHIGFEAIAALIIWVMWFRKNHFNFVKPSPAEGIA